VTDVTNIDVQVKDAVGFTVHDTGKTRGEYLGPICGVVRPTLPYTTGRIADAPASETTKPALALQGVAP